jgi:hypothetical protein
VLFRVFAFEPLVVRCPWLLFQVRSSWWDLRVVFLLNCVPVVRIWWFIFLVLEESCVTFFAY